MAEYKPVTLADNIKGTSTNRTAGSSTPRPKTRSQYANSVRKTAKTKATSSNAGIGNGAPVGSRRFVNRKKEQARATTAQLGGRPESTPAFAPGSRPGVITVSGDTVFKNGRRVSTRDTNADAQAYADRITQAGANGRVINIMGDNTGETFRQLNRVDQGSQTGNANLTGIQNALQSRGMEGTVDTSTGRPLLTGTQRIGATTRQRPSVTRDMAKEEAARTRIMEERGLKEGGLNSAQQSLLDEAVNLDVYGTATPRTGRTGGNFNALAPAGLPSAQGYLPSRESSVIFGGLTGRESSVNQTNQAALNDRMATSPEQINTVLTSDMAREYTNEQIAAVDDWITESSMDESAGINGVLGTDDTIAGIQASSEEEAAMLEQQRQTIQDEYNAMKQEIQATMDAREIDYKQQIAQMSGAAMSQLASMGIYGQSSAGIGYVNDLGLRANAQLAVLGAEESSALISAFKAYQEADYEWADKMIQHATDTRANIKQAKQDVIDYKRQQQELRAIDRADAASSIEAAVAAGMTSADIPPDFLDYLDRKSGYTSGTSAKLLDVTTREKNKETAKQDAMDYLDIAGKLPVGQQITIDGVTYSSLDKGKIISGTEIDKNTGEMIYYQVNQDTGEITTKNLGIKGSTVYDDYTTEDGLVVRKYGDGKEEIMFDPSQWMGGQATGGIIGSFPDGSVGGWCAAWVNDLMGTTMGDSFENKMSYTDPSITGENAGIGDIFVQKTGGTTGHTGIINGRFIKNGQVYFKVSESNWNNDGIVHHDREVPASQISGYIKGGFIDPNDRFNSPDTASSNVVEFSQEAKEQFVKIGAVKKLESGREFRKALLEYKALIDNYGGAIISPSQKKNLRSAYGAVTGALKNAESLGTLDEGLLKYMKERVPSPEKLIGVSRIFANAKSTSSAIQNIITSGDKTAETYYNDIIAQYPEYESYGYLQDLIKSYGFSNE